MHLLKDIYLIYILSIILKNFLVKGNLQRVIVSLVDIFILILGKKIENLH